MRLLCKLLNVSASGYYDFNQRTLNQKQQANQVLDKKIEQVYQNHHGRYGMPRIHRELNAQGDRCGRHRVARRLQHLGLRQRLKNATK